MALEKKTATLTEEYRKYLLSRSPQVTPDNPTQAGWSASKIRQYQWKPLDILFTYLKNGQDSFIEYVNEAIEAINANETAISNESARAVAREDEIEKNASDALNKTELSLKARINTETERAKSVEGKLQTSIDSEVTRATTAEGTLQTDIVSIRGHPTDDETATTIYGLKKLIDKAYDIAESKSSGFTFLTVDELIDGRGSNLDDYSKVRVGDNIYIIEKNVCDFWVATTSTAMPSGFVASTAEQIKAVHDGETVYVKWGDYYLELVASEGKEDIDDKLADIREENNTSFEVREGQVGDFTPKRNYEITYKDLITSDFTVSVPATKDIRPAFNNGFNITTGDSKVNVTINSPSHLIIILNGLVWEYENTIQLDEQRKISSMFVFNGVDWYWYITEVEITWTT